MPISKLDSNQVLKHSFDDDTGRLKVDAQVTATMGTVDVVIDAASGDNIAIKDGSNTLLVNPNGSINVNSPALTNVELRATPVPINGTVAASQSGTWNVGSITTLPSIPAGTNSIGTVQAPTIIKGTQSTTGFTVQNLTDSGRNQIHYYTIIPVLTTATDTLQSLTGTKSGATVAATTTPTVVSPGKIFRITRISGTYISTTANGYALVRLRFNPAGLVEITSPIAVTMAIGAYLPATVNSTGCFDVSLTDGWEFDTGTGIGISVQGFSGGAPDKTGYVMVSVTGFEY